jgi:hypothetical protein
MLATMNVAEKIAPLAALSSDLPLHVHDVRFDEGADGEMWVYVNAIPDPPNRQRYLCFVARDDSDIANELALYEASLGEWLEQTKVAAAEFGQSETKRLQAGADAEARSRADNLFKREMVQLRESDDRRQYDAALLESAVQERIATRATRSAEAKAANPKAAEERAKHEEAARAALDRKADLDAIAAELKVKLETQTQVIAALKETERTTVTEALTAAALAHGNAAAAERAEKLAKSPPPNLTERIADLRALMGKVVVHESDHSGGRRVVAPSEAPAIVAAAAEWMSSRAGRAEDSLSGKQRE